MTDKSPEWPAYIRQTGNLFEVMLGDFRIWAYYTTGNKPPQPLNSGLEAINKAFAPLLAKAQAAEGFIELLNRFSMYPCECVCGVRDTIVSPNDCIACLSREALADTVRKLEAKA